SLKKKLDKHNLIHLVLYAASFAVLYLCIALISAVFFNVEIIIAKLITQALMIMNVVIIFITIKNFNYVIKMKDILTYWIIGKHDFILYYRKVSPYNLFIIIFYALCIIFLFVILSLTIISRKLY